ncbi:hypothetical protein AX17_000453 [Amanita inopinata Kibby_2008]|nr:hypothetical protein AX17_000453 [Amanita inopinata Kibby_2008]
MAVAFSPSHRLASDGKQKGMQSDSPPPPASSPPTWAPPKAPLPPHRLAKLANALGIPIPALHSSLTRHHSESASTLARSPSPSTPSTSKYLLHVIPPLHLPHNPRQLGLTPPPSAASGYHTHYRRGVLVPVYASFYAQLAAIAKEYALPSTAGIVLYLVTTPGLHDQQNGPLSSEEHSHEPGPRLSEEIWKHIWTRVLKAEQLDDNILSQSPSLYRLDSKSVALSTPSLPQENGRPLSPLRPLLSTGGHPQSVSTPFTPSSSASSAFDQRSNAKSFSPTFPSDPNTPDTSAASQLPLNETAAKADSLILPGLNSSSIIPVLAKIEFDIDRRKAGWYEPWLRSRRINHAKRTGVKGERKLSITEGGAQGDGNGYKKPPLSLLTGTKDATSPISLEHLAGYASDSHYDTAFEGENSDMDEDVTARLDSHSRAFASSHDTTNRKPIPPPLVILPEDHNADPVVPYEPDSIPSSAGSVQLPYLKCSAEDLPRKLLRWNGPANEHDEEYARVRSPEESEKRVGAIFDDLDLGLDPSDDYDCNDLNDRRRSQFLMKAKLDEIERTMAQLSPRALKVDLDDESVRPPSSGDSTHLMPHHAVTRSVSAPTISQPPQHTKASSDPPQGMPAWPSVPFSSLKESLNAVKTDGPPSLPRLAVNGVTTSAPISYSPPSKFDLELSPETERRKKELEEEYASGDLASQKAKQLVVGSPVIPLSPDPFGRYPSTSESGSYWQGPPVESRSRSKTKGDKSAKSLVTSRFSIDSVTAEEPVLKPNRTTLVSMKSIKKLWRKSDKSSHSNTGMPPNSSTGRTSTSVPPSRPERPSQEELGLLPMPDVIHPGRVSTTLAPPLPGTKSVDQLSVTVASKTAILATPSHLNQLHFDQESPYPTAVRYTSSSGSPPQLPASTPELEKSTRRSILKWRSKSKSGSISQTSASAQESRTSSEQSRPPSVTSNVATNGTRNRKLSVGMFGSAHGPSSSMDIPPSPQIPEQFLAGSRQVTPVPTAADLVSSGQSQSARSTTSNGKPPRASTDSHIPSEQRVRSSTVTTRSSSLSRPSSASHDTQDRRPSLDVSQFEIVSPKAATLTYPYHELDHE